ncbi:MAG: WXG100 family type VII secretion target, partial [Actinoplanes sp.]
MTFTVDAPHRQIVEDIERIAAGVRTAAWLDGAVAVARDGLSGLAPGPDPVGVLRPTWLLDQVRPLTDPLDWLAGDPAQVSAHAQAWRQTAHTLGAEADHLSRASRSELPQWSGPAADAYAGWAAGQVLALGALSRAASTVAAMSEDAGALIGTVRRLIRDAVVTVVSKLLAYAPDPAAASELCAECASRITQWLRDLIANLRRLNALANRLTSR